MAALADATLLALSRISVGTPVTDDTDFTAMTPAQVAAKFELASYGGGGTLYAFGSDGDYDALDPDDPPITDLGLWSVVAFVNELPGSLVGESLPAFFASYGFVGTYDYNRPDIAGLPAFRAVGTASAAGATPRFYATPAIAQTAGLYVSSTHIARLNSSDNAYVSRLDSFPSAVAFGAVDGVQKLTRQIVAPDTTGQLYLAIPSVAAEIGDAVDIDFGPAQIVKLPYNPPVLALSSAATTTKLAAITQREVNVWKPFVVLIEATTGEDPGAHQVYWSLSGSASNLVEIYRATSTDQITLHVRANGVSATKALGSVADNTAFKLAVNVFARSSAASLNGGTTQVLVAPKPSGVLTLESIGCKHDGTLQCGGPIAECNLTHPAVWTAAQLEAA